MGFSVILDYALFQLTPTRTRCDLILFYGGKTEKLAAGLFEPFISHLKFAEDQISKGGYSIKLSPPTSNAPWFTKATFERFVRFVNTPAVLERFVILEKEILQIESSAQANELSNANVVGQEVSGLAANSITTKSSDSSKLKGELERSNGDATPEENSKIQLQRLLETRKMLLLKEQAMAYARGLVAGFEVDSIDDLISFADAFGASRLRQACIDFKELCKKKCGDGLWMEELAAVEACPPAELSILGTSGIVLNNDAGSLNPNITLKFTSNGSLDASKSDSTASHASFDSKKDDNLATSDQMPSTTTKVPMPMPWPNHISQYMYNFQNPMQQIPPYHGFLFPMQPIPPHYAMNMQWPSNLKESGSVKKEKLLNKKGIEDSGKEEQTESSNSEIESNSDSYTHQDKKHSSRDASHREKNGQKSSKAVVIRNINYFTPKRRNGEKSVVSDESSSDKDDFVDDDSLKQKVDDAVGSLEKLHKSNSSTRRKNGSKKSNGIANGATNATARDSNDPLEGGKTNENWDAFRHLLMKDEEATINGRGSLCLMDIQDEHVTVRSSGDRTSLAIPTAVDLESEKVPNKWMVVSDSFVASQKDGGHEDRARLEDVENAENCRPVMKRRDSTDGDLVVPLRMEESGSGLGGIIYETELSTVKPGRGEDWFVINHSGKPENHNSSNEDIIFNGDHVLSSQVDCLNTKNSRNDLVIDDSFMVHARPPIDDLYDSQWKTDIHMAADLVSSSQPESSTIKENHEKLDAYEPDDLYVVLERDSGFELARNSWATDRGIESIDISLMETDRRSTIETSIDAEKNLPSNCDSTIVKKKVPKGRKVPGKDVKPKISTRSFENKTGMLSKTKKPSLESRLAVQKSKLEQEKEIRKKMEELLIQRQKRIAERTAASGFAPAVTKKIPSENKQVKGSVPRVVKRQTM